MAINKEESPVQKSDSNEELQNKAAVQKLYKELANGHKKAVSRLLASDLEWWFHGPPQCHHMMRVLTGESNLKEFRFEPRSITAIGDCVIAEGWEGEKAYWVRVWTLKEGIIMQFREYFNTWLVVTDLRAPGWEIAAHHNLTLWQSQPRDLFNRSLPGLVLALWLADLQWIGSVECCKNSTYMKCIDLEKDEMLTGLLILVVNYVICVLRVNQ